MSFREIWEASFPPKPKPDLTLRIIKGTVERCSPFHQGEYCFGFTYLLAGQSQPFRHDTFGEHGFPELTEPGDTVTVTLSASNQVVRFVNHDLDIRLSAAAPVDTSAIPSD
jgi:hypothetical protein